MGPGGSIEFGALKMSGQFPGLRKCEKLFCNEVLSYALELLSRYLKSNVMAFGKP